MKKIILLGASGSIGTQTQQVVRSYPEEFEIIGISVHSNIEAAFTIIKEFNVKKVVVYLEEAANRLKMMLATSGCTAEVLTGMDGLLTLVKANGDIVVNALVGSVGVLPTIEALKADKDVALANKEALVTAGAVVMQYAQKSKGKILPVDSEHSAIFQCLEDEYQKELHKIILTASGGSLRDYARADLKHVTVNQVLAHPNWSMGKKITVDCATMMNKGFEVIEAHWLFDVPYEQLDVVIHRESTVHSMVEYVDGSILAHLGKTDMRIPIQYALTYPQRRALQPLTTFDWSKGLTLNFSPVSYEQYPILKLAYEAGRAGGTYAAALNAANEIAVAAFLQEEIGFLDIQYLLEKTMDQHVSTTNITLEEILHVDERTRIETEKNIQQLLHK